jgi:hypothetical protein
VPHLVCQLLQVADDVGVADNAVACHGGGHALSRALERSRVEVLDAAEVLDDLLTVVQPFSSGGHVLLAHGLRDHANVGHIHFCCAFRNCLLVAHLLS